ncbi:hypothetical protein GBW32_33490 [Streptomyces tsukubensis]|nr:hypothetical protein GBW32_33490 [Streptomyces tsukubensis]
MASPVVGSLQRGHSTPGRPPARAPRGANRTEADPAVSAPVRARPLEARPRPSRSSGPRPAGPVAAAELLRRTESCDRISHGLYRRDAAAPADIPVCGGDGMVHRNADLDVDCDGRPGRHCDRRTDPYFQNTTAYAQSDGRSLSADELPYIVVPGAGSRWNPSASGVRGGSVAAVIHQGRVVYAVVGDTGPADIIGEASWATARRLGVDQDPTGGGAASGVTYIVFTPSRVSPVEDRAAAVALGERLASEYVGKR